MNKFFIVCTIAASCLSIYAQPSADNGEQPSYSIETDEVVVSGGFPATQHENAVKIEVLKLDTLRHHSTSNFTELLTRIPGVDMISKGSGVSKPVIRGLSMNDILVLSNGVRYENYQYSSHHPLGIGDEGIEQVEVIKGPASLLYGSDAIGGVINFIKEKPAPQNTVMGDYALNLFSNSLGMSNNLGIKGASEHLFGGIRVGQQSTADYLMGGGDFVPNSRTREQSVNATAGYTGTPGTFNLYYDYSKQQLGLVEDEPVDLITERGRNCSIFYQQLNTHLISSRNKVNAGTMKLDINGAYQQTELTHMGDVSEYELQMSLTTLTYEAKLHVPWGEQSDFIVGGQGINQFNTNLNDRETILLPDAVSSTYSGFALLQQTFFNRLKVQAGLRYDQKFMETEQVGLPSNLTTYRSALNRNYGSFSGSLGATYHYSESLLFRANLASAYRTPNLAELTSNGQHETRYEVGDASLVPEKSMEGDVSVHYHRENLTVDVAGFYNAIRDYIFISPTGALTSTQLPIYQYMQQNSTLVGGEAGVHYHPNTARWLHLEGTFASVVGKQQNGDYLPFIPAQKLNGEIRVEKDKVLFFDKAFVFMGARMAFDQNRPAPDETATAGYTLFDVGLNGTVMLGKQLVTVSLSANNVLDTKYVDHLSTLKEVNLFDPGRNIILSVKIPFAFTSNQ